jgi:hypothetical protein
LHDIHAETNALSTMIASGATAASAIFIAAEGDQSGGGGNPDG